MENEVTPIVQSLLGVIDRQLSVIEKLTALLNAPTITPSNSTEAKEFKPITQRLSPRDAINRLQQISDKKYSDEMEEYWKKQANLAEQELKNENAGNNGGNGNGDEISPEGDLAQKEEKEKVS